MTPRFIPSVGGTEIHTWEVAQRLSAQGFRCTVLTVARESQEAGQEVISGITVVRVDPWRAAGDLAFAPAVAHQIRALRPAVMHLQGIHTLLPPIALLAARRNSIPYIVTFHSGGHSSRLRNLARPPLWRLLRSLLLDARQLIAVSEFERRLFSNILQVPLLRFSVIPSGIEIPDADRAPSAPAPNGKPFIVSVGRLERYKGHHRIIHALPVIARRLPTVSLRIVGSGPEEKSLLRLVHRLGLNERVTIAGVPFSERPTIFEIYRQADVITLLSEYESQGIAAMEALAVRRPVVVDGRSALGELAVRDLADALPRHATRNDIADVVVAAISNGRAPDVVLPSWDDTVSALRREYESIV